MSAIRLAVLGEGRAKDALRAHGAPLGRVRLVEGEADAVLVLGPAEGRAATVAAALAAGRIVLCPPPVARDAGELQLLRAAQRQGGGRLLPAGEIAHSEAGRRALAAIRSEEFGALRSLYVSIRQARGGDGDVLDVLGWESLDFVLAAMPGEIERVRLNAGALFGAARDTAVLLLRGADEVVATVELSRCLPASLAAPGLGEVEIEAMGAAQSVHAVPLAAAVRVHRDDGVRHAPWLDAPVLGMLRMLEAAMDSATPDGMDGVARAVSVMERLHYRMRGAGGL